MLIAEPVQNAGGSIVPPRRLLGRACARSATATGSCSVSDEVICAFGRLGHWFGAERFGYVPDLITFAKGLTGAHFSMGGVLISDRVAEPFLDGRSNYLHGFTFGGHPVGAAVALAAIETIEREGVLENVRANEPRAPASARTGCATSRSSATFAAPATSGRSSWSATRRRAASFDGPDADWLLKDVLSEELWSRGLICRLDDRDRTDHPDRAAACRRRRPDRGDRLDPPRGPRGRDRTDGRAARADRRRLATPGDGVDGDAALDAQQRRVDLDQVEALIEDELAEA